MFTPPRGSAKSKSAKEPPVAAIEKYVALYLARDLDGIHAMLDAAVMFIGPTGVHHGRPHVTSWLGFESSVLSKNGIDVKVESGELLSDSASNKSATVKWSFANKAVEFTEMVVLNQVLMIRKIERRWVRREPKSDSDRAKVHSVLLGWTGPQFEAYCTPKGGHAIDNRVLVLPVLDFNFCNITNARRMLAVKPREGKVLSEPSVLQHFLDTKEFASRPTTAADAEAAARAKSRSATDFGQPSKDEITIRAKNKSGDQAVIVVDRSTLGGFRGAGKRAAALDDEEVMVNEDRVRYAASGLRLCNNNMTCAADLDRIIRLCVHNAFYFLTWVDLSCNQLTAIPDLSQYPITSLHLHSNNIADWSEAAKLSSLNRLQTLTLFGNRIQHDAKNPKDYKYRALAAVMGKNPIASVSLRTFDHSVLSPEDKATAERYVSMNPAAAGRPPSRSASRQGRR